MAAPTDSNDSYYAPWEKTFGRILTPFEEFIHQEIAGSLVLIACTVIALVLANSPLSEAYQHVLHISIAVKVAGWSIDHTLHHWINDGLMALFFFVVGLEIKREVLTGELSDPKAAALPIIAAIGGMAVPAGIYAVINSGGPGAGGWGIPMATDIAFAVGVLALLGSRVPKSLFAFLAALAIVDDLGAVAVIAFFYTDQIVGSALLAAAGCLGGLIVLNLVGVRHPMPLLIVSVMLWLAMLASGIHATIAGVLAALTVPSRSKLEPAQFIELARGLLGRVDELDDNDPHAAVTQKRRALLQAGELGIKKMESPLQRLEHAMHIPVAFIIIPLFVLANAGVPLQLDSIGDALGERVTLGIIAGLTLGKLVGVAGIALLAARFGIGRLPAGCRAIHIVGVGLIAGIGFTMSIFVAELGFRSQPELLVDAKSGILIASLIAGLAGYVILRRAGAAPAAS